MRVLLVAALLSLGACARADANAVRTVELVIHHSRFQPSELKFDVGTRVRFVVRNTDPIDHELIVGNGPVHLRHEKGNEARHGDVPGEVSVPAGKTSETTYSFGSSGRYIMGCHLPGHFAYGMRGNIKVG